MGLDLVVEARAKPGHEAEWRRALERAFANNISDADIARFAEISIPGYEGIGAPRVGYDVAADAWIIETRNATTPDEIAATLEEFHGYYALRLVECDGVPKYSHGGLYDGVDETSFRGAFLSGCDDVLEKDLIERAWDHRFPEQATSYGEALLAAARAAASGGPPAETPPPKRGFFSRLRLAKKAPDSIPFEEQIDIVEAAGRWFIFWGERGHAIRAWF
jgi:hypothetical protein